MEATTFLSLSVISSVSVRAGTNKLATNSADKFPSKEQDLSEEAKVQAHL